MCVGRVCGQFWLRVCVFLFLFPVVSFGLCGVCFVFRVLWLVLFFVVCGLLFVVFCPLLVCGLLLVVDRPL